MNNKKEQLSEMKIRQAIAESSKVTVRDVMRYLKNHYPNQYDTSVARKNAKEMIAEISNY